MAKKDLKFKESINKNERLKVKEILNKITKFEKVKIKLRKILDSEISCNVQLCIQK